LLPNHRGILMLRCDAITTSASVRRAPTQYSSDPLVYPTIRPLKHSSSGRGFWTHASVITPPTPWRAPSVNRVAVNPSRRKAVAIALLCVLPANRNKKRTDERTRTAYPCSLRVRCFYWTNNPLHPSLIIDSVKPQLAVGFKERSCHHRRYSRARADARGWGFSLPSKKLNHLSECGQSE
jgi:hypothetical protein